MSNPHTPYKSEAKASLFASPAEREAAISSQLFRDVDSSLFDSGLTCLGAYRRTFEKGDVILRAGDRPLFVGVILSGSVVVERIDFAGNSSITAGFGASDIFGEAFAYSGEQISLVTVRTLAATTILAIPNERIVSVCDAPCTFHPKLTENVVRLIAQRNITLNKKLDYLSLRSTREKLIAYLQEQSKNSLQFSISLNKSDLANYLCVDRSAMSRELGRLRDEGYISFSRSKFCILNPLP